MFLDTKVNGERKLLNMALQKQLYIEQVSKYSTSYYLKLGAGYFADIVGVYESLENAVTEYENICAALKRGDNFFKAFNDEEATNVDQG